MKKILLFKIGAIGDVLMTTPFVRQLGETGEFEIDYMCGNSVKSILIGNSYIHNIIGFDEKFLSKITFLNLLKYISFLFLLFKSRKRYDYVLILDKHLIFNFSFLISGFKNRLGFNRLGKEGKFLNKSIYWNKSKREVEYYLDFLDLLGFKSDYSKQEYDFFGGIIEKLNKNEKLDISEQELVRQYLPNKFEIDNFISGLKFTGKKIIGISTGGGNQLTQDIHGTSDCRWWGIKKWETLVKSLLDKGEMIILIGGKSDRKLNINHINFFDLLGKFSVLESIYLVNKCDYLICQDNGVMHFGGCANSTKIIALFGPTDPHTKYPFKKDKPAGIGWIWKENKECYDCYGSYKNCKGDEIDKITINEVLECIIKSDLS